VGQLRGLVPAILIGVMGNSVIYLIPLLVGGMVSDRRFSEAQAGLLASADLAGYALATFATAMVLDRISWRRMALCALGVIIVANVGTTFIYERDLFALIRFTSGLGCGVLAAIASVSVGQTDTPDRNYGLLFAAALLFGTAALWFLPPLLSDFGLNSAYWLIALLALMVGFVAAKLPAGGVVRMEAPSVGTREGWILAMAVLASIMLFWAEQNAVYAYIERIGNASGLNPEYIGFCLGVANLTGFAGASLVAWLGTRLGRLVPLLIATLLQLICLAAFAGHVSSMAYLVALGVIALSWNVVNPFQLGILAGVEPSGKALALAATVTGTGLAIGPAAGAVAIGAGGYGAILWLAGALAIISLVLLLPPQRAALRQALVTEAS
jgi:predicted MFS family arabinose efflux permease